MTWIHARSMTSPSGTYRRAADDGNHTDKTSYSKRKGEPHSLVRLTRATQKPQKLNALC